MPDITVYKRVNGVRLSVRPTEVTLRQGRQGPAGPPGASGADIVVGETPSGTINGSNAQGAGLTNYNIGYSNGLLLVNLASLLVTALDTNKVYGTTVEPVAYSVAGLLNGDSVTNVTLASAGSVSNAAVGSYAISGSAASSRPITSVLPPAAKPSTRRTGLAG